MAWPQSLDLRISGLEGLNLWQGALGLNREERYRSSVVLAEANQQITERVSALITGNIYPLNISVYTGFWDNY